MGRVIRRRGDGVTRCSLNHWKRNILKSLLIGENAVVPEMPQGRDGYNAREVIMYNEIQRFFHGGLTNTLIRTRELWFKSLL